MVGRGSKGASQKSVNDVEAKLDHAAHGLAALRVLLDAVEGKLDNSTWGLAALKVLIDAVGALIVVLGIDTTAILADTADMQPRIPRIVCHMDFWSDSDDEIALTTTDTNIHNLPNVVVAGLPSDITIIRVVAFLKIALIKDTSGSDNAINSGTMVLTVDADGGYGSTVPAINIPNNSWAVDVSEATERGGDVMIGDNDLGPSGANEVTGNATYYGRFENAISDGAFLRLKDVAWGLRIYFTV